MNFHRILKKTASVFILAGLGLNLSACTYTEDPFASVQPTEMTPAAEESFSAESDPPESSFEFYLEDVPAYSGTPYTVVNNNIPAFSSADLTEESFETYSELDFLGSCGTAYANISKDLMPTEERGSIGMVKPSGWHLIKYDWVDGKYLYNRCHLIAYMLAGENANTQNLITGTRYMNVEGMLPFETEMADYIKATGNHVLYRVTPIYDGDNLVAGGVLMEALSVEDNGDGVQFCVYCYNVQPGVIIDYATGDSESDGSMEISTAPTEETVGNEQSGNEGTEYILNTNTHKFHYPNCPSVDDMKEKNKQEYFGSRDELIAQGYEPCKRCNP